MKQETKEPQPQWIWAYMRWPGRNILTAAEFVSEGAAPADCPPDLELFARYYNDVFFVAEYAQAHAKWCQDVEWMMYDKVWFRDYKIKSEMKAKCWSALAYAFSYLADVNNGAACQKSLDDLRLLLGEENYKAGIMPVVFYYHEKE